MDATDANFQCQGAISVLFSGSRRLAEPSKNEERAEAKKKQPKKQLAMMFITTNSA